VNRQGCCNKKNKQVHFSSSHLPCQFQPTEGWQREKKNGHSDRWTGEEREVEVGKGIFGTKTRRCISRGFSLIGTDGLEMPVRRASHRLRSVHDKERYNDNNRQVSCYSLKLPCPFQEANYLPDGRETRHERLPRRSAPRNDSRNLGSICNSVTFGALDIILAAGDSPPRHRGTKIFSRGHARTYTE